MVEKKLRTHFSMLSSLVMPPSSPHKASKQQADDDRRLLLERVQGHMVPAEFGAAEASVVEQFDGKEVDIIGVGEVSAAVS